jgi:hypothetical protein
MLRPASLVHWCWAQANWTWATATWRWRDPDSGWAASAIPAPEAEVMGARATGSAVFAALPALDAAATASKAWQASATGETHLTASADPADLLRGACDGVIPLVAAVGTPGASLSGQVDVPIELAAAVGKPSGALAASVSSALAAEASAAAGRLRTVHLPPTRQSLTRARLMP